jgi:hypothetical protein
MSATDGDAVPPFVFGDVHCLVGAGKQAFEVWGEVILFGNADADGDLQGVFAHGDDEFFYGFSQAFRYFLGDLGAGFYE